MWHYRPNLTDSYARVEFYNIRVCQTPYVPARVQANRYSYIHSQVLTCQRVSIIGPVRDR